MSIAFETPQSDELINLADGAWREALAEVLGVALELDADEPEADRLAEPVTFVLPYRAAYERYTRHVTSCHACHDTPVWDVSCEYGAELAHLAADAMARMQDAGSLN